MKLFVITLSLLLVLFGTTFTDEINDETGPESEANPDCQKEADVCSNLKVIQESTKQLDFKGACGHYKNVMDCLSNEDDPCKNSDPYTSSIANAKLSVAGICGLDGSLTGCANDLLKCDEKAEKFGNTCSAIFFFETCTEKMTDNCEGSITQQINQMKEFLIESEQLEGCDGACGKLVAECGKQAFVDIEDQTSLTIESAEKICSDINVAESCLKSLTDTQADNACGEDDAFKIYLQLERDRFEGFCTEDGTISECAQETVKCEKLLPNSEHGSDSTAHLCRHLTDTLTCLQGMTKCDKDTLLGKRKHVSNQTALNNISLLKCGDVLKCDECNKNLNLTAPKGEKKKSKFCKQLGDNVQCFNDIKKNQACTDPKIMPPSDYEENLRVVYDSRCDGAGMAHATLAVLFVSIIVAVKNSSL